MRLLLAICASLAAVSHAAPQLSAAASENDLVQTQQQPDDPNINNVLPFFQSSAQDDRVDSRFTAQQLSPAERHERLAALVRTYLATAADLHIVSVLLGETLLGWACNGTFLPWASEMPAVAAPLNSVAHLARYYNMSVFRFRDPEREYRLDVSPLYAAAERGGAADVRWIDTEVGLYLDIATLRRGGEGDALERKHDGRRFRRDELFPLYETTFDGAPARVPHAYADLLAGEFGVDLRADPVVNGQRFDRVGKQWVPVA